MSARQRVSPTHILLFAVYPVLYIFSQHLGEVQYREMILPALCVLGFSVLMWILVSRLYRDRLKAGIVVSIFITWLFFYGYFERAMTEANLPLRQRYLLVLWTLPLLCCGYLIKRTSISLNGLTRVLNFFGLCLVGLNIFSVLVFAVKTKNMVPWSNTSVTLHHAALKPGKAEELPNIYYIVPDRYPRADILKDMYDCDTSEFLDYLSQKGFYVASESFANYDHTRASLASSLNMEHLIGIAEGTDGDLNRKLLRSMVENFRVQALLKSAGYKYVHFGSWWNVTYRNHLADKNVSLFLFSELSVAIYRKTVLSPVFEQLGIYDENRRYWKNGLYHFDKLAEVSALTGPTFVFAHILIPHEPYIFDRDGKFMTRAKEASRSRKENHREQVLFINEKLKELIDRLLAASRVPPIIIIQSDEGPYFERLRTGKCAMSDATTAELRQKMAILNAYYLPGLEGDKLYPSITPVNSFRLVFNHYFGTNFAMLPDESYITSGCGFARVTDRLNDQAAPDKIVDTSCP